MFSHLVHTLQNYILKLIFLVNYQPYKEKVKMNRSEKIYLYNVLHSTQLFRCNTCMHVSLKSKTNKKNNNNTEVSNFVYFDQ